MSKILVAEDELAINKMICMNLNITGYQTVSMQDGQEVLDYLAAGQSADLAIVDIMMPKVDGFALLEPLNKAGIPVIYLTALGDIESKVRGLSGGAEDYMVKPFEMLELLLRIEKILKRTGKSDELIKLDDVILDMKKRTVSKKNEQISLTPMEYDLLCILAKNRNIALGRDKILHEIWGAGFEGETRTVDVPQKDRTSHSISAKDRISSGGRRMKLRSRITFGTLGLLLISLGLCCALIVSVSKKNMLNSTTSYVQTELQKLVANFFSSGNEIKKTDGTLTEESKIKYYFFKQTQYSDADTEYVLQNGDRMLYNNSGLNAGKILELDEAEESNNKAVYDIKSSIIHQGKNYYCICGKNIDIGEERYQISVVRSITGLYRQIYQMIAVCLVIGMIISMIAAVSMIIFLKKSFKPLELLKDEADAISKGEYERHIEVKGKDELASLSQSFNAMAKAVESHIAEVEETSEARNRLIHALSHEMRTPVTAICGYAYSLRNMKMTDEQREEALGFIDIEAKRLGGLSGKLTDLVGLTPDKIELKDIELADLKKHLEMIWSGRDDIILTVGNGSIKGDMELLIMLITNLCDNAKKADATKINIDISERGISVKDNGKGIPQEDMKHIFEIFYQGDASRNQQGFGLGLALCQKIAALHNSRLCVESKLQEGSVFSLQFPYNSLMT